MRGITQPGLPTPERIQWVEARGRNFCFTMEAGLPLLEAAGHGVAAPRFVGGTPKLKGGTPRPHGPTIPAQSLTPRLRDAGAGPCWRARRLRQQERSTRGSGLAQAGGHGARRARRRAVFPLPWVLARGLWAREWRPHSARRNCRRRTVRGGSPRYR